MEPLLYLLIGLVSVLLIAVILTLVIIIKKGRVNETVPLDFKVDNTEMINRINYIQDKISKLQLELSDSFNQKFTHQTEKLTENDSNFAREMRKEIEERLRKLNEDVQKKLTEDTKLNQDTFENIGQKMQALVKANEELKELGTDVKELRKVISGENQKRGKFGEFLLESILEEVFANTNNLYSTQYTLNGVRPDAVIYLPRQQENILCIDAKFPYTNFANIFDENDQERLDIKKIFKEDVKKKIDEISSKYIVKGLTTDYALCFFPSDEIYQYINHEFMDLVKHSRKQKVILVSPSTLQPTLHTMKSLMIEYRRSEKLKEVNTLIAYLADEFRRFQERWDRLSAQIDTVRKTKEELDITVNKLTTRFTKIKNDSDYEEEPETNI